MNRMTDANLIFEAGTKVIKGSNWKYKTQEFEMNQLLETALIQQAIIDRTYKADKGNTFVIDERGKKRIVTSIPCRDKTVNHVLCDNVLTEIIDPYLIHDNGASRTNLGVAFHRRRFEQHMHEFYREHGNEGYILLGDFKSYYASIDPTIARKMAMKYIVKSNKLTDEEIETTNWLLHETLGDIKGINIGGQPSQNIGILYANGVDQYVKTVKSQRYYGRYTDDFYIIHQDIDVLKELLAGIDKKAKEVGLTVHPTKTYITRIDRPFKHLQISYKMTETGKLVKRINPQSVTRERHRLKAYKRLLDKGRMSADDIENNFRTWMYQNYRVMSMLQIQGIYKLYVELFGRKITWKKSKLKYLTSIES